MVSVVIVGEWRMACGREVLKGRSPGLVFDDSELARPKKTVDTGPGPRAEATSIHCITGLPAAGRRPSPSASA